MRSLGFLVLFLFLIACEERHYEEARESGSPRLSAPVFLNPIPSGERIIYDYGLFSGYPLIRAIRPDGSEVVDIIRHSSDLGTFPLLSPSGNQLLFEVNYYTTIMVRDGEEEYPYGALFSHLWILEDGRFRQLTGLKEKNIQDQGGAWSPDGKEIFFTHVGNKRVEGPNILSDPIAVWAIGVDGSNPHLITGGRTASLSHDGETLAVSDINYEERRWYTYFVGKDGTDRRSVRRDAYGCKWRPNGIHLACIDWSSGHLILINKEGELLAEITKGIDLRKMYILDYSYAWSPDGSQIVFTSEVEGETGMSLWKISVDKPVLPVRLTPKGEYSHSPQWVP